MVHFVRGDVTIDQGFLDHIRTGEAMVDYFIELVDTKKLPELFRYIRDKSVDVIANYIQESIQESGPYYVLAQRLQSKALHPDNNMLLHVLENGADTTLIRGKGYTIDFSQSSSPAS